MPSGQHFQPGLPLAATASFTGTDVDNSTSGLRLASNRLIGIRKSTAPLAGDSPDYLQMFWVKPSADSQSFELYINVGLYGWVPVKGLMDLTNSVVKTLPVDRLVPSTSGKILASVPDLLGTKAAWIDLPLPYTIGVNGTVLTSDGITASFNNLQGEAVHSASVATQVWPLMSDGSGHCVFQKLPTAAIVPGTGSVNTLVSRMGVDPSWETLNLFETTSYTTSAGTSPATGNFVPAANGTGGIFWANPKVLANTSYETSGASRVALSSITAITDGNYNAQVVDTLSWTTQSPANLQVFLECTSTQNGYATGSRIPVSALTNLAGTKSAYYKFDGAVSGSTVTVVLFGKYVQDLTNPSGASSQINLESTGANWKFVVVASKF